MEETITLIQPELVIVTPVIYIIGVFLKKSTQIKDKYIPLILGGFSIALCLLYFLSVGKINNIESFSNLLFSSVVQGILIVGCATYSNQVIKQLGKKEE